MGDNEGARSFGTPATTLRRRKSKKLMKCSLGHFCYKARLLNKSWSNTFQNCVFSYPNQRAQSVFSFVKQLGIKHRFSKGSMLAEFPLRQLFLQRKSRLSVRKAEGISINRSLGAIETNVAVYYHLLENTLTENYLMCKPGYIYSTDETVLCLNSRP